MAITYIFVRGYHIFISRNKTMFNKSLKVNICKFKNHSHKQIYAYNQLLTIFAHLKLMAIYTQECGYTIVGGNFKKNQTYYEFYIHYRIKS